MSIIRDMMLNEPEGGVGGFDLILGACIIAAGAVGFKCLIIWIASF